MKSLPPSIGRTKRGMVNILEAVLLGNLTVWIVTDEDQEDVIAVVTTKVQFEEVSKTRDLLIYSFTSFGDMSLNFWNEAYETLEKYAVSQNCQNILAYTTNEEIIDFFNRKGAKTDNRLIQMEV